MIKKVAVINDLSGFGKCSLTAAIAILSVMKVQPCPMPTAILTNQTGFENYFCADFTDNLHHYSDMWEKCGADFDGIYSGFVSNIKQIDIISKFILQFRRSYTKVLVDPVMADNGKMYSSYNKEICDKMCSLTKKADLITPNLTELCFLTDTDYKDITAKSDDKDYLEIISETAKKALTHSEQNIAVTGIKSQGYVYNGLFSANESYFVKSKQYGTHFSGTGDIFASILCAEIVNGNDLKTAVKKANDFLELTISDTVNEVYSPNNGVNFEKFLYTLS